MKKRLLSLGLAAVLVATGLPGNQTALAAEENSESEVVTQESGVEDSEIEAAGDEETDLYLDEDTKEYTSDGITFSLSNDYVLTVSGNGKAGGSTNGTPDDGSVKLATWVESAGLKEKELYTEIKKIIIKNGITELGSGCFESFSSLETVEFEETSTCTVIGSEVFLDCSNLRTIKLPDSVTSIGGKAFSGCSSLGTINIPSAMTGISDYAFESFDGLKSITIPNTVTSIGRSSFSKCTALETITIPENVNTIGDWAFWGCSALKTVTINAKVNSIGDHIFYGCSSLSGITIPNTVTKIESSAFLNCSSLSSISLPDSLQEIGDMVFDGCSSLTSIAIPSSVTKIGQGAFTGCSSLESVTIPSRVTEIEEGLFSKCSNLKSVTLPSGITSIGDGAFAQCETITEIQIPEGVNSIGEGAFAYCKNLTKINLPSGLTSLPNRIFDGCVSLKELVIPGGVTSIGDCALQGCDSLTSIEIPENVTTIGNRAFAFCDGLTELSIPKKVTTISSEAFYSCTNLTTVRFPVSVTSMGNRIFDDNSAYALKTIYYDGTRSQWDRISYGDSGYASDLYNTLHSLGVEFVFSGSGDGDTSTVATSGVSLDRSTMTVLINKTGTLRATIAPSNATNRAVTWSSSDNTVATVEDGVVTGVKEGTATITVTTADGDYTAICEVTVASTVDIKDASVSLSATSFVWDGTEKKPTVTVTFNGETLKADTDYTVSFSADVIGSETADTTVTVTVTGAGGNYTGTKTATYTIKAPEKTEPEPEPDPAPITALAISQKTATLAPGATLQLSVTVTPANADPYTVKWSSSSEAVTVSNNGLVTALKEGISTVTANVEQNLSGSTLFKSASCKILVTESEVELEEDITVSDGDTIVEAVTTTAAPATVPKVNGVEYPVTTAYSNATTYTGKKINPAEMLDAEPNLDSLYTDLVFKTGYEGTDKNELVKISYVSKNNKAAGDKCYFYVKVSATSSAKKALTSKSYKTFTKAISAVNKQLKKPVNRCKYTINKRSVTDGELAIQVKKNSDGSIKVTRSGKVSKVNYVKLETGEDDAGLISLPAKNYSVEVIDAKAGIVKVTGLKNFTGSVTVHVQ